MASIDVWKNDKICIILWYHVPLTCITTYFKLLSLYPFSHLCLFQNVATSISAPSVVPPWLQVMHRHRAVTSANFSTPHWSNQMSRIRRVGPTSTKDSCLDLWCRHLLRLKKQQTPHRFLLTTPLASLFDQSAIPMLSTAHPFVNHRTLKWKVFDQQTKKTQSY